MSESSAYKPITPLYEETKGVETNKAIVLTNIKFEFLLAALILGFLIGSITGLPDPVKAPPFIWVTLLLTMLLVIDRALWQNYHLKYKEWVVTDSPSAHSFERTTAFIMLAGTLIGLTQEGPWEDVVESDIAPTLLYALCTVPILHILGSGWKTLKANPGEGKEEITWTPYIPTLLFLLIRYLLLLVDKDRNQKEN